MDVTQYLEIFLDETKEHLQSLSDHFMVLEQEPDNMETINEIFRSAHTLKGMAGTMGYKRMQTLTHDMEDVFSEVRNNTIKVDSGMVDLLFQCLDALEEYTENIQNTQDEGTNDNEHLIKALNDYLNKNAGLQSDASKEAQKKDGQQTNTQTTQQDDTQAKDGACDNNAENTGASSDQSANASKDRELWRYMKLDEAQKNALRQTIEAGEKCYGITVYVQENCILKAARAFLVFKSLEEHGEIVVSQPSAQDIEDERFDLSFSVILVTREKVEKIKKMILDISEIHEAYVGEFVIDSLEDSSSDNENADLENTAGDMNGMGANAKKSSASNAVSKGNASGNNKSGNVAGNTVSSMDNNKKGQSDAQSADKPPVKKPVMKPVVNRTVRVDIEKLDVLMNLVSELIIAKNSLVAVSAKDGRRNDQSFNEQVEYLESVTTNLHESVMKVRMVPIETVVQKFPKMIRDLSKKLDKKMQLVMSGEETELDRTVVDEIGDPLMHLLRNSADHGIEASEERIKKGKPEVGTITLKAYQDGNNVVIEVGDDGNGIDIEAVKQKAVERGNITPDQGEKMTDKEIVDLLFLPSFSTSQKVTDVSGRGVGLDVVKSKIESLSGEVEVKTVLGEGSTFIIRLPLTLAIIQALMVEVGGEKYAVSLGSIQTIEDVEASEIRYVQAKEVINLRGSVIPLIRMNEVLDIESTKSAEDNLLVIIVKKGDKYAGLVVDELIGQQEIVIKSLGKYIDKCRIISGATILGDGEIALILDTNALL